MEAATIKTTLAISSPAFRHEGNIPSEYTCDGHNYNPTIEIRGVPTDAKSVVLIVEDPDAPVRTFDHWVMWDVVPTTKVIQDNSAPGTQGRNSRGTIGYAGPCPPQGTHRYFFRVFALNKRLGLQEGTEKEGLLAAMENHVLAYGELMGKYTKT